MTYPTPAPYSPGGIVSAPTVQIPKLPTPVVVTHEVVTDATRYTWEIVLDAIKNIVVIVTCLMILYALHVAYSALSELGDSLSSITG